MREYRFQAGEENVEHFRRLRGAWRDVQWHHHAVVVRFADGTALRVEVDRHDIEPGFAAVCLVAEHLTGTDAHADLPEAEQIDTSDLGLGGNDVVLFTGATWLAPASLASSDPGAATLPDGFEAVVQQAGCPTDVPEHAEAVCLTHDAVVCASPIGTGCLLRIASIAGRLDVITDRTTIAGFLTTRGYVSDEPESESESMDDASASSDSPDTDAQP
jgi:hypothetical protein